MRYNVALELLKRVTVPIEADHVLDAERKVQQELMQNGMEFIKDQIKNDTFDSIKIAEVYEQSDPTLGTDN